MSDYVADTAFKKWYQKNKPRVSEERKERYHNDPVYRAKCLAQARRYRKYNPRKKSSEVTGLYRIGEVAKEVGVTVDKIRYWESIGAIPVSGDPGSHRRYTIPQISLMKRLNYKAEMYEYDDPRTRVLIREIKKRWNEPAPDKKKKKSSAKKKSAKGRKKRGN